MKQWFGTIILLIFCYGETQYLTELNDNNFDIIKIIFNQALNNNFDEFIKNNKFVLVEFYCSWCRYCAEIEPILQHSAKILREELPNLRFAKIDTNIHYFVREEQNIEKYPTLKLFVDGHSIEYDQEIESGRLSEYLKYKANIQVKEISTKQAFTQAKYMKGMRTFLVGGNEEQLDTFRIAAKQTKILSRFFYISKEFAKSTFPDIKSFPTVVVLKDHEEPRINYRPALGKQAFKRHLEISSIPDIAPTTNQYLDMFLGKKATKTGVILARDENEELDSEFQKLRSLISSRDYIFMKMSFNNIEGKMVMNYLKINRKMLPVMIIVSEKRGMLKMHIFQEQIISEKMYDFFIKYEQGKIHAFNPSEDSSSVKEGVVKRIVGSIFGKEVLENSKHVMVMFFSPSCVHCRALNPIYKNLAQTMTKSYSNLKFVEIDSSKNAVERISISGYPTLYFFAQGRKEDPILCRDHSENGIKKCIIDNMPETVKADL